MTKQTEIIGKIFHNPKLYYEYERFIKHLIFSDENQTVFDTIQELLLEDKLDKITVKRKLKAHSEEVQQQFNQILSSGLSANNFESLIYDEIDGIVKDKFFNILFNYQQRVDQGEFVVEVLEQLQDDLSKLVTFEQSSTYTINDLMNKVVDQMESNMKIEQPYTGIKTGFDYYDKFSKGLQKSDLIIIAGETSQGKTSLALNMIREAEAKTAIYSLEMSALQLTARLMAQSSEVNSKTILFEKVDPFEIEKITGGVKKLRDKEIYIDEINSNSIYSIISSIKQMKIKYGIDIVVVDYLQLVNDDKIKGREQEVGQIARKFKNLAKQLEITVILVSQLNRDKHNPKPTLGRLRDSGQIEEAADQVIFVYRPEYYGKEYLEPSYNDALEREESKGLAQIIIAKGRNIGIGEFALQYVAQYTLFKNWNGSGKENTDNRFNSSEDNFF